MMLSSVTSSLVDIAFLLRFTLHGFSFPLVSQTSNKMADFKESNTESYQAFLRLRLGCGIVVFLAFFSK